MVDAGDKVIGKELRSKIYSAHRSDFRVVNAFLRNSKGEIWIPRRTADKSVFPLCLDMSMGGHAESGETYDQTFRRELMEELRLDADAVGYKVLGKLSPADGVSAFMTVYEVEKEEAPDFNPRDFTEYFWLTPQALLQKIAAGDKSKEDLPKLVRKFYL